MECVRLSAGHGEGDVEAIPGAAAAELDAAPAPQARHFGNRALAPLGTTICQCLGHHRAELSTIGEQPTTNDQRPTTNDQRRATSDERRNDARRTTNNEQTDDERQNDERQNDDTSWKTYHFKM